ncbi:transposase domain-containing protein [Kitasatospora sp. NPDC094015]|uniref:transposase domain-containing protein n=1 Tax=Kitasatospora sp. NPDC094015 TaxID=3155205 RepID=UPI00332AAFDC
MARTGQFAPVAGERLTDLLGVFALTWALPSAVVDGAVAAAGRTERRRRSLPARTVLYFTLAMWLYPSSGYGEVMRLLSAGLARKHRWVPPSPVPSTAAITKARQRLGPDPLRLLFERVAGPAAGPGAPGAFHREWRVLSLDTTLLDVQDSPANRAAYGVAGAPLPQVRVVALAEGASRAVCAAALGAPGPAAAGLTVPGPAALGPAAADPVRTVLGGLRPGQLVLAGHRTLTPELWTGARALGADLLWRAGPGLDLPVLRALEDGSYLSRLAGPAAGGGVPVRVVECPLPAAGRSGGAPVPRPARLLCSILEPARAGAAELARLYGGRWRLEALLDELGALRGGARPVLRSKSPAMVEQEVWAMFLAHHAVRALVVGGGESNPVGPAVRAQAPTPGRTGSRAGQG